MANPIRFVLNDHDIEARVPPGSVLVDFIRNNQKLCGTTVACREGDCGACTILVGELRSDRIEYRSITSCIYPIANVHGKHVVTVEGLAGESLNPIQETMRNASGTQCGFCTPGFVVSLAGLFLKHACFDFEDAISAIDGNICRCTGYKSIERAVASLVKEYGSTGDDASRVETLVRWNILPQYFLTIPERLKSINKGQSSTAPDTIARPVGGGSDLYVQVPEEIQAEALYFTRQREDLRGVVVADGVCAIGAATSLEEIRESRELNAAIPGLSGFLKLFGSTQIRQQATLGGNLVNASPIGDSTAFFLALKPELILERDGKSRSLPLEEFFLDYKKLNLKDDELVHSIRFPVPGNTSRYNFEKVSRRRYLDIASVNSGFHAVVTDSRIERVAISAGGLAATPRVLSNTAKFLCGKRVDAQTVLEATRLAQEEVAPISDVRGSAEYKRLLFRQLLFAHFLQCFPEDVSLEELL